MKDRMAMSRKPEKLSKKVLDKDNTFCYLIKAVFESKSSKRHGAAAMQLPGKLL